jgi:hypothetical protein
MNSEPKTKMRNRRWSNDVTNDVVCNRAKNVQSTIAIQSNEEAMLPITKNFNIYSIQRVALCNRLLHFLFLSSCHRLTSYIPKSCKCSETIYLEQKSCSRSGIWLTRVGKNMTGVCDWVTQIWLTPTWQNVTDCDVLMRTTPGTSYKASTLQIKLNPTQM